MATFGGSRGRNSISFTKIGNAVCKTAKVKIGKNGKQYATFGFSDESSMKAYTVTVCLNPYTPTASNAKYPNQDCVMSWIQQSKMSRG